MDRQQTADRQTDFVNTLKLYRKLLKSNLIEFSNSLYSTKNLIINQCEECCKKKNCFYSQIFHFTQLIFFKNPLKNIKLKKIYSIIHFITLLSNCMSNNQIILIYSCGVSAVFYFYQFTNLFKILLISNSYIKKFFFDSINTIFSKCYFV